MRSQKLVRDELRFVSEFTTLLDVTQQVAVSKLQRLEEVAALDRSIAAMIQREFFPLVPVGARIDPWLRGGERGRLLIVLTSDEGMVGALHAGVIREAQRRAQGDTQWLMIGQRGLRLLGRRQEQVRYLPMPTEETVVESMQRLRWTVMEQYLREGLRAVDLVAPRFVSPTHQDAVVQPLLPMPVLPTGATDLRTDLVIEPELHRVLEVLAGMWIEHTGIETFWSARRAELAARALHVESSRQALTRQSRRLRHEFFKALHERVDVNVRETCVVQRLVARQR